MSANSCDQYQQDGPAEKFICRADEIGSYPWQVTQARAKAATILINKYKGGSSVADPASQTIKKILKFWAGKIATATASDSMETDGFEALNSMFMSAMAGAIARQDKNALPFIPTIHAAIASDSPAGETVARSMDILVRNIPYLSTENHAITKPLYKQWAYYNLTKSLYDKALPISQGPQALRYTTAILSIVKHVPFTVYEPDLDRLVRLVLTVLSPSQTPRGSFAQYAAALEIVGQILANDPQSLKEHLRAVITSVTSLYAEAKQTSGGARTTRPDPAAALCRKLSLELLAKLPQAFEERHLLPHSPLMQRMLASASGDSVREVRKVALTARQAWATVA